MNEGRRENAALPNGGGISVELMAMKLYYNAAAHFWIKDRYPDGVFAVISQKGKAGFEALCEIVSMLARQGVAHAKIADESDPGVPSAQELAQTIMLHQVPEVKKRVLEAVSKGLHPDSDTGVGKIETAPMLYNAAAHFEFGERHEEGVFAAISQSGLDGFSALCDILSLMMCQAELLRRTQEYDAQRILSVDELQATVMASQVWRLKERVLETVTKGLQPEAPDENEEIDEVLAELQKKTENG